MQFPQYASLNMHKWKQIQLKNTIQVHLSNNGDKPYNYKCVLCENVSQQVYSGHANDASVIH